MLSPGQGSQTPGMLSAWLTLPGAADRLAVWSKAANLDLERLGTTATVEEITDTAVTQPLIVAAALLAYAEISNRDHLPTPHVVAGHSVGELAALAIAGVISADDAVALAAVRGAAMAHACDAEPTGMSAVLGGDENAVLELIAELGLEAANRNAAGQIVAAGTLAALDTLAARAPERARIRPLAVAGAFHTRFMEPARDAFADAVSAITPEQPTTMLLSNSNGRPVTDGGDALTKLAAQITSPVRWDLCTAYLREHSVASIVELPPSGALVGIAKRELKGTPTLALKTPDQLNDLPGAQ